MMANRQISILLPEEIIQLARRLAKNKRRPDGLKLTPSALLREWTIRGAEVTTEERKSA